MNTSSTSICPARDCKPSCPHRAGSSQKQQTQVGWATGSGGDCGQLQADRVIISEGGSHTQAQPVIAVSEGLSGCWDFPIFQQKSSISMLREIFQFRNAGDKFKAFSTPLSEPWNSPLYHGEYVYPTGFLGHRGVVFDLSLTQRGISHGFCAALPTGRCKIAVPLPVNLRDL